LYEGLKVAAGPDLILAYIDVFLGGDEKRPELPPKLIERLPMSIIFGGNGSYLSPYNFHSDNLLTSLLSQVTALPPNFESMLLSPEELRIHDWKMSISVHHVLEIIELESAHILYH